MRLEIKEVDSSMPTICLNMIVKNESKIIRRLLDSVSGFIDSYCICDTGSTDDTIDVINKFSEETGIPGKVVIEPFKNFAYSRSFALQACVGMSDYVLLLDADMIFQVRNFDKKKLSEADTFCLFQGSENFYYKNMRIVRNNGLYKYVGVTHEHVAVPPGNHNVNITKEELFINDIGDGGSKNDKFERDIRLLLDGIKEEPNNVRYHFYLANSYKDSGHFEEAIEYYKKRIEMGDWEQEVWYSNYNIANIYEHLGKIGDALYYWLECYNLNPLRLENIYKIVHHYRVVGKCKTAKIFYDLAKEVLKKNIDKDDYLFLQNDVYTYKFDYEFSIIAGYVDIFNINDAVVSIFNNCNDYSIITNVLSNMKFYKDVLKPRIKMDLSFREEIPVGDKKIMFNSSSCSLLKKPDSTGYFLNIRMVNYRIDGNGNYLDCDQHIITNNRYMEMDNKLRIKLEKTFDVDYEEKRYLGIEDIRIFTDDEDEEKLIYMGTSQHKSGKIGMLTGVYDSDARVIESSEIVPSFSDSYCEKNWVHFKYSKYGNKNHLIYKWCPMEICKINKETNQLDLVETKEHMPRIFSHARGSTPGFTYNNEVWFILHIVAYESPRNYYHIFAVFDLEMNFLRNSSPFKFEGEPIEYCLGLVVENDRVLATYSTWDGTTKLVTYDKSYVDSLLKYK
jgi:tetratricopeptide (TPR) repeat protein